MFHGASDGVKAAPAVTGEQLEMMLQEWDTPLVIDAYATWYVLYVSFFGIRAAWQNMLFSGWNVYYVR